MPLNVEEFHHAWANQVLRAQSAETNLDQAKKRIAELEAENLKLKTAVENAFQRGEKERKEKDVPAKT